MNDAEYPDRFVAALHDTGLNEADQGALKGIISGYYETNAKPIRYLRRQSVAR